MRQDGFILGNDPEAKGDDIPPSSTEHVLCIKCGRGWPSVRFTKTTAASPRTEPMVITVDPTQIICDNCWPSELSKEVAQEVDEATGVQPAAPVLVRSVMVTGIESRTNVIGFQFPTHVRGEELTLTDIQVTFKGKQSAEIAPCPVYVYKDVPLIIAQVWCEAPSHGESFGRYFIEQIKNSYAFERKV